MLTCRGRTYYKSTEFGNPQGTIDLVDAWLGDTNSSANAVPYHNFWVRKRRVIDDKQAD